MEEVSQRLFRAALFDLDGVVFDTEPQYTEFWRRQCREFHPEKTGLELEIKGQTLTQIYDKYFNGALQAKRQVVTDRLNAFERQMDFSVIAGFENFLNLLRTEGVRTAIVTSSNKQKMAAVAAKRGYLLALFDAILTSEDFTESKPSPDCYLKGAMRLDVPIGACVVFEDSFNGLKAGRAANMKVVGLATTNAPSAISPYADVVITNYNGFGIDDCERLLR